MSISRKTTIGLLCYLILSYSISLGQDTSAYIPLISSDPNDSMEDIKQLDQYFENVQIVGMGESTHGTHEFSTMRHRFFKYLIINHGFTTIFLEADYANCLMINAYVQGAKIDKYEAISKIDMWPWMTEEMGDLLDWMRAYNIQNPKHEQLSVIGVDVQKYNATLREIDNLLSKYGIAKTDTFTYKSITDNEFVGLKKKELKSYLSLLEKQRNIDTGNFSKSDKQSYNLLLIHFGQILESRKQEKNMVYRDQKMGENILYHLSLNEDLKGLFWAHNGHVFSFYKQKRNSDEISGFAGGILKVSLGSRYLCIVQEFDEGTFNANYLSKPKTTDTSITDYTLGAVTIEPSIKNSFGAHYRNTPDSILFIDIKDLTPEGDKFLWQHSIGGLFIAQKENSNQTILYDHCTTGCFDAMILIKKSSPTNLIR